jgi:exopolysaccharide biosynthesis polyprenyl glycosylphosphotransferase
MSSSEGLGRHQEAARSAQVAPPAISRRRPSRDQYDFDQDPGPRTHDRFWRDALLRRMLALADLGAGTAASLVVGSATRSVLWALAMLPVWIVIAKLLSLYDRDQRSIRHLTVDELPAIAAFAAAGVAVLGLVLPLTPGGGVSFDPIAWGWLAATITASVLRGFMRWLWRRLTPPELTAVIGDGGLADACRRKIDLFPDMHLRLVEANGLALDGDDGDRLVAIRRFVRHLDRLIVAWEPLDPELVGEIVGICREEQVKLSIISPLRGGVGPAPSLSTLAELPILEYDTRDTSRSTMLLKRIFDVSVASVAGAVFAPLVPVIALAIKLDSPGPVIFVQRRAGKNGAPFRMFKFRTMTANAEAELQNLLSIEELPEPVFKLPRDPRVTRIGRILRRFSLDELPQLANVLRGDMSVVGPRPEQIELVERYRPEHRFRLDVKPGLTGPMQVYGRGDLSFAERLAVESDYVENLSLARDLRILLQTLPAIFHGGGAY